MTIEPGKDIENQTAINCLTKEISNLKDPAPKQSKQLLMFPSAYVFNKITSELKGKNKPLGSPIL